jgi:hypothetical protein
MPLLFGKAIICEICHKQFGDYTNREEQEKRNEHMKQTGHNVFGSYDKFLFFKIKVFEKRIYESSKD